MVVGDGLILRHEDSPYGKWLFFNAHLTAANRSLLSCVPNEFSCVSPRSTTAFHYDQPESLFFRSLEERVQNIPLWQSYAVKKQTMHTRANDHPDYLVNNKAPDAVERKWLFHGTTKDVSLKIVRQGFNRAFAGRNAVAYGKGVYFARDASYSSQEAYSEPDHKRVQRIFLCRVAVGDWCKGKTGQLTPDTKNHNNLELFDSTVDNICLEPMMTEHCRVITTKCQHTFHRGCLLDWMVLNHDDCPTCRTVLLSEQVLAKLQPTSTTTTTRSSLHGMTTTPEDRRASYCFVASVFILQGFGIFVALCSYLNLFWFKS